MQLEIVLFFFKYCHTQKIVGVMLFYEHEMKKARERAFEKKL